MGQLKRLAKGVYFNKTWTQMRNIESVTVIDDDTAITSVRLKGIKVRSGGRHVSGGLCVNEPIGLRWRRNLALGIERLSKICIGRGCIMNISWWAMVCIVQAMIDLTFGHVWFSVHLSIATVIRTNWVEPSKYLVLEISNILSFHMSN